MHHHIPPPPPFVKMSEISVFAKPYMLSLLEDNIEIEMKWALYACINCPIGGGNIKKLQKWRLPLTVETTIAALNIGMEETSAYKHNWRISLVRMGNWGTCYKSWPVARIFPKGVLTDNLSEARSTLELFLKDLGKIRRVARLDWKGGWASLSPLHGPA